MTLPDALVQDLQGGGLRLRRWDAEKRQASFHVTDHRGRDVGIARFAPVQFLCVPTRFEVATVSIRNARDLPTAFWGPSAPSATSLRATDMVYFFTMSSGLKHYLVAGGLRYDRS